MFSQQWTGETLVHCVKRAVSAWEMASENGFANKANHWVSFISANQLSTHNWTMSHYFNFDYCCFQTIIDWRWNCSIRYVNLSAFCPHSTPTPAVKPAFANCFGSQEIGPVRLSAAMIVFRWWKHSYNQLGNWVVSMTTTLRYEHRGTGLPCAGAVPTYLRTTRPLKLLSSEVCHFVGGTTAACWNALLRQDITLMLLMWT